MPESVKLRKKLIEVALPLDEINAASVREKSIRHGHPSTLHLWWARRPLAAARAVIFSQMVNDPSSLPELFLSDEVQEQERQRLFRIIEELVKWENTTKTQRRKEINRNSLAMGANGEKPQPCLRSCGRIPGRHLYVRLRARQRGLRRAGY